MTDESRLEKLARRVADGEQVDWEVEERRSADPGYLQAIRNLKRLAAVAGLQDPAPEGPGDQPTASYQDDSLPEGRIGPYRLLQKVGEGGMGEVWEAEQEEPVRRRVALKLIKWGMDTKQVVARFESERQALALMDHPSIAKVFDAGATEKGRPYFVMEYVKGVPINLYCDTHRLTTRERLELFGQVCDAVQHAHHKAIIHRDLKPSNVLVTEQDGKRLPKIIDFGIAKATAQKLTEKTLFTELGALIGTPEYMSPEQAELTGEDVDTRTDVYSLGVILYELLVGALPFDPKELRSAGYEGIRKKIREEEPHKPSTRFSTLGDAATESARARQVDPSTLERQLRGDLDWLTMRALEKDRTRRYGSPMELAADIGRYLANEPVLASPPSAVYRAKKFVRRHRFGVVAAAASVVALVGFAATMAVQAKRIASERDRAEQANADLELVVEFQSGMLSEMDTEGMGRRLMEDLASRVGEVSRGRGLSEPEAETLVRSFDDAVRGVNATDAALRLIDEEILARAVEALEKSFSEQPLIDAELRQTIGVTYRDLGLPPAAEPQLRRALETRKRVLGGDHPDTLWSMNSLADSYRLQGHHNRSEPLYLEVFETRKRVLGPDHPNTLKSMHNLARALYHQRRYGEAEPLFLEALESSKRVLGDDHPRTLGTMNWLANLYRLQFRYNEAESLHRETLDGYRRLRGADHQTTIRYLHQLTLLYEDQDLYDEAEALYRERLATQRRILGDDHPTTLHVMRKLAHLCWRQGRFSEAESLYLELLEGYKSVYDDEQTTLSAMNNLGVCYRDQGRTAEAERLLLQALEGSRRALGDEHHTTHNILVNLGNLYKSQGRYEEARPLVGEYMGWQKKQAEKSTDPAAGNAYAWTALTCEPADLRDPSSALRFALAANEETGYENPSYLDTLALAYHLTGDTANAIETQEQALSLLPEDSHDRAELKQRLAEFETTLAGAKGDND